MNTNSMSLFQEVAAKCSMHVTKSYSTSFSLAVSLLDKNIRQDIYNIYGFVRFADEIVDTFHAFNKEELLERFQQQTFEAIRENISLNPILHSFQYTVNKYQIDPSLIRAFFRSMEMDLERTTYDSQLLQGYIYGSAEVVGLMCLSVFVVGDNKSFFDLSPSARALGSAFQKINFLRDVKDDLMMKRSYYPAYFNDEQKKMIEKEIEADLALAFEGIMSLPENSKQAVWVAYKYYRRLFDKIRMKSPNALFATRTRVPNYEKFFILLQAHAFDKLSKI